MFQDGREEIRDASEDLWERGREGKHREVGAHLATDQTGQTAERKTLQTDASSKRKPLTNPAGRPEKRMNQWKAASLLSTTWSERQTPRAGGTPPTRRSYPDSTWPLTDISFRSLSLLFLLLPSTTSRHCRPSRQKSARHRCSRPRPHRDDFRWIRKGF